LTPLYVAKTAEKRALQRALLQYYEPENAALFAKLLKEREGRKNAKRPKKNAPKNRKNSPHNKQNGFKSKSKPK
jgi:hypothetical protein